MWKNIELSKTYPQVIKVKFYMCEKKTIVINKLTGTTTITKIYIYYLGGRHEI